MRKVILLVSFLFLISYALAATSQINLAINEDNDLVVTDVSDDDGSIGFVDVFVTTTTVQHYSFHDVIQGQLLIPDIPLDATVSYNFQDIDGSVTGLGYFIYVQGATPPQPPKPPIFTPTVIEKADIKPRVNEHNNAYYLDVTVDVNKDHPINEVVLQYSYNIKTYDESRVLIGLDNRYKVTLGPFTGVVVLFSKVVVTDSEGKEWTANFGERWYELMISPEACQPTVPVEIETKPLPEEGPNIILLQGTSTASITIRYAEVGLVASDVFDDDGSIAELRIHVIEGGIESEYMFSNVTEGQQLPVFVPEEANAYYNFADFDGSIWGWGMLLPIAPEIPELPQPPQPLGAELIDAITITSRPNSSYDLFYLDVSVAPKPLVVIDEMALKYGFRKNDYSKTLPLIELDENYEGTLGPFYPEVTLYSRAVAVDDEGRTDYLNAGVRWYKIIPTEIVECIEICWDGADNDGDGLIDEGCILAADLYFIGAPIPNFFLFEKPIEFSIKIGNSGLEDAGPFDVAVYLDETLVDSILIDGLMMNEDKVIDFSIGSSEWYGRHNLRILIDAENDVPEMDEENNELIKSIIIAYNAFDVVLNYNNIHLIGDRRQVKFFDMFGKVVEGAYVELSMPNDKLMSFTTDEDGLIEFTLEAGGKHSVKASKEKFEPYAGLFDIAKINVLFSELIPLGEIQKIQVITDYNIPVSDSLVELTKPTGETIFVDLDENAVGYYKATVGGRHTVVASRKQITFFEGAFTSVGLIELLLILTGQALEALVGTAILQTPWLLFILIIISLVAAAVAYNKSVILFKKIAKSSRQQKIEKAIRIGIAIVFFILPLQVNKFFGFGAATLFVLAEIVVWFVADYVNKQIIRRRKAIKVKKPK